MLSLKQSKILVAATVFATAVKIVLALTTQGSTDVEGFADHLVQVRKLGVGAYHVRGPYDNPFNSPPPMIHGIKGIGVISDLTSLPFAFWLRFFPIIAGMVSVFLVWRLLRGRRDLFPLLLALSLSPVSIIIDGYHGNTDSVVIMFVLLAICLTDRAPLSGFAFGLGCCVKLVPLMFVPAFLLCLPNMKARTQFAVTAAALFVLASMPFIVQDVSAVKNVVFGYGSIYGTWGVPQIAAIVSPVNYVHPPFDPLGVHAVIASILKYLTLALILLLALWLNRRNVPLFTQCGIIIALVLFLAPGFGPQYLVWLVPFVVVLGLKTTIIYYGLASFYLLYKYTGLVDVPWLVPAGFALGLFCWLFLLLILIDYRRSIAQESGAWRSVAGL